MKKLIALIPTLALTASSCAKNDAYTLACCMDIQCEKIAICGVYKPSDKARSYTDELGSKYYRVYKGDFVGLESINE